MWIVKGKCQLNFCITQLSLRNFIDTTPIDTVPLSKVSRSWRSQFYIVPILLFSILYNTPKFFELEARKAREAQGGAASLELETNQTAPEEVDMRPSSEVHYSVQPTALRVDRLYVNIYLIFMNLIINGKDIKRWKI